MNRSKSRALVFLLSGWLILGGSATGVAWSQDQAESTDAAAAAAEDSPATESPEQSEGDDESSEPSKETAAEGASAETAEDAVAEKAASMLPTAAIEESGPWTRRVEELGEDILRGEAESSDADALLAELKPEFKTARDNLRQALDSGASPEELTHRHEEMEDLYDARLLLLSEVSPVLRVQLTGLSADGVREGREELDRLQLHMRYQARQIPTKARDLGADLRTSPIPLLQGLLALIAAIIAFRLWRRWAAKTLPAMRQKLLTARPRLRRNIRFAKLLWYLDRLRGPLEWLILLGVITSVIQPSDNFQEEDPIWLIIKWVFIGWLGLSLVDAIATRGGVGLAKDDSGLRLRSLKLVWGWIASFGLGIDLAREYVGEGTLYDWTWLVFMFLGIPVAVLLTVWWRDEVFVRLAKEPDPPQWIQRLLVKNRDRKGYLGTALGGLYLIQRGLRHRALRLVGNFEFGRRVLAHLFRQEVERQAESQRLATEGDPLSEDVQAKILAGGKLVSKAHRKQKREILELAEGDPGWFIALTGERGLGKSTLLQRLSSDLGDRMLIVDCPTTGYRDLLAAMKGSVGLSADPSGVRTEGLRVALSERQVDVVAIDNVHRVASPRIGGLKDLEELLQLIRDLGRGFSWIFTLDSLAWQYIRSARGGASGNTSTIDLESWSEEEIAELMMNSAAAAGIEPDFSRLVLPRQLDEMVYEAEADRKQHGFSRILWYASDGNPAIALRQWCDSMRVLEDGKVSVHLFSQRSMADLEDLNLTNQFILRSIAQMEYATVEDILEATRLTDSDVQNSVRGLLVRGLIEREGDMLRLSWHWDRLVTRLLRRKNLLAAE